MKNILLLITFMGLLACNGGNNLPPVVVEDPYVNPYSGNFFGLFIEEYNGVDSDGVFKSIDSFDYVMEVIDAGDGKITIQKGAFVFNAIPVMSNGTFSTDSSAATVDSLDYSVNGYYTSDSLYIEYKAINGGAVYPQWFTIVSLSFRGKKVL